MRALRRHHRIRLKKKRSKYHAFAKFDIDKLKDLNNPIKCIDTPKPCSCFMCGNPRKHWNEETRQEKISRSLFIHEVDIIPSNMV